MSRKDGCVLAVDIGGSKIVTGLADLDGNIHIKVRKELDKNVSGDGVSLCVMRSFDELMEQTQKEQIPYKKPICAGITIPGLADPKGGIWVYSSFSGIKNYNIVEALSEKLKMPVFIENDVNACAYGERLFGCCKDTLDFIWMTISNGIGGGIVLNGEIYEGAFGYSGEIGHMIVAENGRLCQCGNLGCLEAQSSGVAIAKRYLEKIKAEKVFSDKIDEFFSGSADNVSAKSIAAAARAGDNDAIEIYNETGYYLGKAIALAVSLLNPEKVVLGGGVAMEYDLFIGALEKTVKQMVFRQANRNIKIEKTALGYDAAIIGAAAIAIRGLKKTIKHE